MKAILLLAFGMLCFAQTAEVHDLTADESQQGRELYQHMLDAEKAYHSWAGRMATKYLKQDNCAQSAADNPCWTGEFSKDFKHIVPMPPVVRVPSGNPWFSPAVNSTTSTYGMDKLDCAALDVNGTPIRLSADSRLPCSIVQ